jgi:hypothetical protein
MKKDRKYYTLPVPSSTLTKFAQLIKGQKVNPRAFNNERFCSYSRLKG